MLLLPCRVPGSDPSCPEAEQTDSPPGRDTAKDGLSAERAGRERGDGFDHRRPGLRDEIV